MINNNQEIKGLTHEEVKERINNNQVNRDTIQISKSYASILKDNVFTLFNLINVILAGLIIFVGSYKNLLFLGVVISNTFIGLIQEIRAKLTLDKLSLLVQNKYHVLREGEWKLVDMQDLVIDDIIKLENGNQISCDSKVINGKLEVNESLLTGESDLVTKKKDDMLYSGSFVVAGSAMAQIKHVGDENYANQLVKDAKVLKRHKSQLRDSLNVILKIVSTIIVPLGILLFSKQYFLECYPFKASVVTTVAALLGMIPEGLVLLTSVALAVSVINLSKKKTLVQELYCIETLARVNVMCLDKTGTITEGVMKVKKVIDLHTSDINLNDLLFNFVSYLEDNNSTFMALKEYATDGKLWNVKETIPFSSDKKYSGIVSEENTYHMGAMEFICPDTDEKVKKEIEYFASLGNRVLVLCENRKPIGLLLLSDTIRKEARDTLNFFKEQGVAIKIISGDHPLTVSQIAKGAGLEDYDKYIDAGTLQDEVELYEAVQKYSVFGRVTPVQKKMMVEALKSQGNIVAMSGDGVNDVPALKEADCSIAFASGSDAAKNISNLVLLDNNFAHMPSIVMEGRRVINNIERAASLFLVKTGFSSMLSVIILFLHMPYPFQPIQLTLISTLTIGVPSFFLALEPNTNIVQGNFILNVLSKALPGSLTVIFNIIMIYFLSLLFHFPYPLISTLCVIATGYSGLNVLRNVSAPFTKQRRIIFYSMCMAFIFAICFLKDIFYLETLTINEFILCIIMLIEIPIVMKTIKLSLQHFDKIKNRIINIKVKS